MPYEELDELQRFLTSMVPEASSFISQHQLESLNGGPHSPIRRARRSIVRRSVRVNHLPRARRK